MCENHYKCNDCQRIKNGLICVLSPFYEEDCTDLGWSIQALEDEVM